MSGRAQTEKGKEMNRTPKLTYPKLRLSSRVEQIPEALSVYINNLIYRLRRSGERVVTLSLGEAYFDLPFFGFTEEDVRSGYHYSESMGIPALREKVAAYYGRYGASVDPEREILISAGSKPIVFMALQSVLEQGDEVLVHEPAWLSYPEQIKLAGGVPVFIPYDCPPSEFGRYVTDRTKAVIINNPNNPAGVAYAPDDLMRVYEEVRSRGGYVIVDEAYSDFVLGGEFESMAALVPDRDGVIVVNSLSKNLGISGWRVGYVISSPDVVYAILKLNQHLITCAPTILLNYLARNFDALLDSSLPQAREEVLYRERVRRYVESSGLRTLGGSTTFYMFVDVSEYGRPSLDLAMHLLMRHRIGVVPGSAYGESTDGFIRIGVGAESEETVMRAVDTIVDVVRGRRYDGELVATELDRLGARPFVG